jgi:hypothetical protein
MNRELSRNIIIDLLPAYLSGEASAETRALVEAYMKEDSEFAQLIKTESKVIFPRTAPGSLPQEAELATLKKTRHRLNRRAWHLGLAIFFTLLSITFHIGPEGFHWTWLEFPGYAVTPTLLALCFWIAYFHGRSRMKATGV